MYAIIRDAKQNIQTYSLTGTVGSVSFTQKNVVGNFTVSNKGTNPSTFNLGNASIGQLTGTFHGLNIDRNGWKGLYITPVIHIGNFDIPYPSKRYRIDKADHTNGMVSFTAYDDMELFEKSAGAYIGQNGTPYDWLTLACRTCGVTLGMTQEEVEAMPNGSQPLTLEDLGDIETWRDILYWIGVTLSAFSFINRQGKLELKNFHSQVDDTLPVNVRYDGATYNDTVMTYTGVYVTVNAEGKAKYYAAQQDTGYTLSIGANPFLQGSEAYRKQLAQMIAEGMNQIEYISGKIEVPFAFQYDLGDVLQFPGGNGDLRNKFCLLGYEYTYNGKCKLSGIPDNKKSTSKSDKNIQNLLNNTNSNEFKDYEQNNTKEIQIADQNVVRILSARLASNNPTRALIHLELNLETEANDITESLDVDVEAEQEGQEITASGSVAGSDIFQLVSQKETRGIVTYRVNGYDQALMPTEQWTDGKHVLHLMYVLGLEPGEVTTFEVYMKADGGSIKIPIGNLWFYASGRGLVGDGAWDGLFDIEEEAAQFALAKITFDEARETLTIQAAGPTAIQISDAAQEFAFTDILFDNANETLNITIHTFSFPRVTEDGKTRITEDGKTRITEGE